MTAVKGLGALKKFKKVYLEITNVCNLSCGFCHKTSREKHFMTKREFYLLAEKIRPHTEYLYFHLMGEPLLHPDIAYFLSVCADMGFKVTVSTNGTLIEERGGELLNSGALYKINFSLHSFEANPFLCDLESYIKPILAFCLKAADRGVLCVLRLWNGGGENKLNEKIIASVRMVFPDFTENARGFALKQNIYLEYDRKFIWPDINEKKRDVRFCMGLRDHIGVLCDGSVVPCCLDADGRIILGSLFSDSLENIVSSQRAEAIYNGFSQGRCAEELCSRCEYAQRFNK